MIYISTWKNARELGKSSQSNTEKDMKNVNIELKTVEVNKEKKVEDGKDRNTVDNGNTIKPSELVKE